MKNVPDEWDKARLRYWLIFMVEFFLWVAALLIDNFEVSLAILISVVILSRINSTLLQCPKCKARCSSWHRRCKKCGVSLVKDYAGPVNPSQIL